MPARLSKSAYKKLVVSLLEAKQTLLRDVEFEARVSLDARLLARAANESRPLGSEL